MVLWNSLSGQVSLPSLTLCGRAQGGHLCVHPPRPVWERGELSKEELTGWACLVAATGQAMLAVLPALADGCVNYWEAGNWALSDGLPPKGPKPVRTHRRVHLHVFGRSRASTDPDWRWGEAPGFPEAVEAAAWASRFEPLWPQECAAIAAQIEVLMRDRYDLVLPSGSAA